MVGTAGAATSPTFAPIQNSRAVLRPGAITWRQATEGWVVLLTLSLLGLAAGGLFKLARSLHRSRV
jgi:hypothetical protein